MSIRSGGLFAKRVAGGLLLGLIALVASLASESSAQVSEVEQLRRELAEHRKYVESLEKRLQSQEAKAIAKEKDPGIEAGYDGGFYVKSKDKPFSFVVNGLGQFRYTLQSPVSGGGTNQTFDVVLGRLAFSGHIFD